MASAPEPITFRAPGRVNLIGEHTDYNQGFVLPIAIGLHCCATLTPNGGTTLRATSLNFNETRKWLLADLPHARPQGDWSDYVAGVAVELLRAGFDIAPVELTLSGNVPIGSGLSSSASLEVAVALALLNGRAADPITIARICHRAENSFVGLPCGMMDQFVSLMAVKDSALLIDCRDFSYSPVALPLDLSIVAVNSMVKHELSHSAYPERVLECSKAASRLGLASLREASAASLAGLEGTLLRRARHVVNENQRVLDFVDACRAADPVRMGQLMVASHRSLQRDYEVSCPELDFLVSTALSVQGVLGARMTGGGFGGCTVNLMARHAEPHFREQISECYQREFGRVPGIYSCQPVAGAAQSQIN